MDEIPELAVEAEIIQLPQPTTKTLARDAFIDLAVALGSGIGVILCVSLIVFIVTGSVPPFRSPLALVALLLSTQLPLIYFGLRRRRRNREKQLVVLPLFAGNTATAIIRGVSAGLALTVLSALYSSTLQRFLGPDAVDNQLEFVQDILNNKPVVALLIFIISVLAPICEELFFRGAIFGSAHAAGLSKAGAAISAVLFAFVHLSPLLAPFYATFAVVMCWLYARTGSLAAPIAAHMTLNGVACAALLFANGTRV